MSKVRARVKFVSIEPMLEDAWCLPSTLTVAGINWVIFGAQTNPYRPPELDWLEAMVEVADIVGAKVWLKDNLWPLLKDKNKYPWACNETGELRQEFPIRQ